MTCDGMKKKTFFFSFIVNRKQYTHCFWMHCILKLIVNFSFKFSFKLLLSMNANNSEAFIH